jgi:deazaflavin-dependent oxidoreductase (nitroreductase family)
VITTEYVDLIVWEAAAEHLVKGQAVSFSGRLEPHQYATRSGDHRVALELHGVDIEYGAKPRSAEPSDRGLGVSDAAEQAEDDIPFSSYAIGGPPAQRSCPTSSREPPKSRGVPVLLLVGQRRSTQRPLGRRSHKLHEGSSGRLEATDVTIRVSRPGTRGTRFPTRGPLAKLFKLVGQRQIRTYRRGGEQRLSSKMGFPVVLLTTRGAKTGETRTTPLGGFPDGENAWLVAASLGGAARHPAWFLNMAKHPDEIWLEVGPERFRVHGESLEGRERDEALARIAAVAPRYGEYQEKTDREIPIVRLTREP